MVQLTHLAYDELAYAGGSHTVRLQLNTAPSLQSLSIRSVRSQSLQVKSPSTDFERRRPASTS